MIIVEGSDVILIIVDIELFLKSLFYQWHLSFQDLNFWPEYTILSTDQKLTNNHFLGPTGTAGTANSSMSTIMETPSLPSMIPTAQ